jgi:cysteine synthase
MANRGKGYGPPLNDISESVGNTPLVKISSRTCPPGRTIYAKCEYFNPLSSVKDRLALAIIEAGEKDGSLKPGQTVVEATSGNTGIGESIIFLCFSLRVGRVCVHSICGDGGWGCSVGGRERQEGLLNMH